MEAAAAGVTSAAPFRTRSCCPRPVADSCASLLELRSHQAGAPRGCVVGPPARDFDHIVARLQDTSGPGLALIRYADGERQIMRGARHKSIDGTSVEENSYPKLQLGLIKTGRGHFGEEFYYGVAGPDHDAEGASWMLSHTEQTCGFITYANIWVNSHLDRTASLFRDLAIWYDQRIVLVINSHSLEAIRTSHIGLAAVDALPIDPHAIEKWENASFSDPIISSARALAEMYDGFLFVVGASVPGKILIDEMWEVNCRNKYIDFGSSVDNLLAGKNTRNYPRDFIDSEFALTRVSGVILVKMD